MRRLAALTNPNKKTEDKANFFVDYFHFYFYSAGKFIETELENPLSLVEKIIFQIEANKNKNRTEYISNYLMHAYFKKDIFLKKFDTYKPLKHLIKQFLGLRQIDKQTTIKEQNSWLKSTKGFLPQLMLFRNELENSMFQKTLDVIINYLLCDHELEKHSNGIKYLTKILVTELILSGKSQDQISNLFNRILSKSQTEFPFP